MTTTNRQIEKLTNRYIKEAVPLFYQQAVELAQQEIASGFAGAAKAGFKVANGNGTVVFDASRKNGKTKTKRKNGKRKNGSKRTKEQLVELQNRINNAVQKAGKNGCNAKQLQEELGLETTKEMSLLLKKLITDKKIRKTGQKANTTYFSKAKN